MRASTVDRVTIESRRERDYKAWHEFEDARRLRNELTNASERLTLPMMNVITLNIDTENGELYSEHGEQIDQLLLRGIAEIEAILPYCTDYKFELERRVIERNNMQHLKLLAHHDILVEFSPIPDAVRDRETTISGYDRNRMKMLIRVSQRIGYRIETVHFALDGSNRLGIMAAAAAIDHTLPNGGSESILATPATLSDCHTVTASDIAKMLRDTYDASLSEQYGGQWHAGRRPISLQNGLDYIEQQTDLIDQHMTIMNGIAARIHSAKERMTLEEMARYDFAAALDDRLTGKHVRSVGESGDTARTENRSYDGDCPTGMDATTTALDTTNAELMLQRAGLMQGRVEGILECVTCPFCKKVVNAIKTKKYIICPPDKINKGCGRALNLTTGKISKIRNDSEVVEPVSAQTALIVEKQKHIDFNKIASMYTFSKEPVLGGVKDIVIHKESGYELNENDTRQLMQQLSLLN